MNDGGSAFPHHETTSTGEPFHDHLGMSLRDYFAGQALAGILSNSWISERFGSMPKTISIDAYLFADAMLLARDKQ